MGVLRELTNGGIAGRFVTNTRHAREFTVGRESGVLQTDHVHRTMGGARNGQFGFVDRAIRDAVQGG